MWGKQKIISSTDHNSEQCFSFAYLRFPDKNAQLSNNFGPKIHESKFQTFQMKKKKQFMKLY